MLWGDLQVLPSVMTGKVVFSYEQTRDGAQLPPAPSPQSLAVGTSAWAHCATLELPPWAPITQELPARQCDHHQPGQADPEARVRRCLSGSIPCPLWSRLSQQREVSLRTPSSSFPWLKSHKERRVRGFVARRVCGLGETVGYATAQC